MPLNCMRFVVCFAAGRAGWDRDCPARRPEAPVPARCGSWPPPSHPAFSPDPKASHTLECSESLRPHSSLLLRLPRPFLKKATTSYAWRMALPIIVKWGGQEYSVTTLSEDDTVLDLKQFLKTLTGVLPERQKLLGLKVKGKPAENDVKLGALKLKLNTKIMMMGTREESLEDVLCPPPDNDDVINDFDIEDEIVEVENREENLLKISRRVKEYKVEVLNPPREGKKLLVLDVDYTLFAEDLTGGAGDGSRQQRTPPSPVPSRRQGGCGSRGAQSGPLCSRLHFQLSLFCLLVHFASKLPSLFPGVPSPQPLNSANHVLAVRGCGVQKELPSSLSRGAPGQRAMCQTLHSHELLICLLLRPGSFSRLPFLDSPSPGLLFHPTTHALPCGMGSPFYLGVRNLAPLF
ncbi:hypothetical protein NN561_007330 [Cricetulus griseus]